MAQQADSSTVTEACSGPAFRAFDFWIGEWVVHDSSGARVGTSRIAQRARGCAILEEWSGAGGSRGTSLNYYDSETSSWRQEWVGSDGFVLHLSGSRKGRTMELTGTRPGDSGPVMHRIRWRSLPDGRVRQEWTSSTDGGTTWDRVFLGFYSPRANGSEP